MKYDLHNHTIHSDGLYTSKELIESAVEHNVDGFALTDHDSVFGIDEIMKLGNNYPVQIIPGMELSTLYKGENVHIVCLFKRGIVPDLIRKFSENKLLERKNRSIQMMHNVASIYGLKMNLDELMQDSEIVTRGNMLRHLMKHNNMTKEEAWSFLSSDSKAYVPSTTLGTKEGLEFAHQNDCFCIFAHPGLVKQEYIEEILAFGFDGIEAFYPTHSQELQDKYLFLAQKYHLLVSGGSDCHGDNTHAMIGSCTIDENRFALIWDKIK